MIAPLPIVTLNADRSTLLALKNMTDYKAVNPAYSTEALIALNEKVLKAAEATDLARKALAAARDAEIAAEHAFHQALLGAKTAVVAQYGSDSPVVLAIGLKKKSDKRRSGRRSTGSTS